MNKKTSFMIYTGFQSVLVQEYNVNIKNIYFAIRAVN